MNFSLFFRLIKGFDTKCHEKSIDKLLYFSDIKVITENNDIVIKVRIKAVKISKIKTVAPVFKLLILLINSFGNKTQKGEE